MTAARLRELASTGKYVEVNLRVRARIMDVMDVSDAHGLCVRLQLETRDYVVERDAGQPMTGAEPDRHPNWPDEQPLSAPGPAPASAPTTRSVWVDEDEIVEVQP